MKTDIEPNFHAVPHPRGCIGPLPQAPEETVTVVIEGGEVRFVHNDDVTEAFEDAFGEREIRRASNVEPGDPARDSSIWIADMSAVGGPILRGDRRSSLIKREVLWLEEHGVPFPTK